MITESPELGIMQLLRDDADVGLLVRSRIYALAAPARAVMPYIVVTPISLEAQHHLQGAGTLFRGDIQVDAYGRKYAEIRAIARAMRRALHGRPNPTYVTVPDPSGANPAEPFTFQLIRLESDQSDLFQPTDASDVPTYRASHSYRVAYNVAPSDH